MQRPHCHVWRSWDIISIISHRTTDILQQLLFMTKIRTIIEPQNNFFSSLSMHWCFSLYLDETNAIPSKSDPLYASVIYFIIFLTNQFHPFSITPISFCHRSSFVFMSIFCSGLECAHGWTIWAIFSTVFYNSLLTCLSILSRLYFVLKLSHKNLIQGEKTEDNCSNSKLQRYW